MFTLALQEIIFSSLVRIYSELIMFYQHFKQTNKQLKELKGHKMSMLECDFLFKVYIKYWHVGLV